MKLKREKTSRGFGSIKFEDRYGQKCSLQDSSLATEAAIWFGVDNTGPRLPGPSGKTNEEIMARMHLTASQVKQLLPYLIKFAEEEEYICNMKEYN